MEIEKGKSEKSLRLLLMIFACAVGLADCCRAYLFFSTSFRLAAATCISYSSLANASWSQLSISSIAIRRVAFPERAANGEETNFRNIMLLNWVTLLLAFEDIEVAK